MSAADRVRANRALQPLLGAARRVRDRLRLATAPDSRTRALVGRVVLIVQGVPARRSLPARRTAVAAHLAALPEPPIEARLVSVVAIGDAALRWPVPPAHVRIETVDPSDAEGELLCIVGASCAVLESGWLARLAAPVRGDVVAATPLVLRAAGSLAHATPDDLHVESLGYDIELVDDAPRLHARDAGLPIDEAGRPFDKEREPQPVLVASPVCILVDRAALVAAGGIDMALDADAAIVDLSVRLRARGGLIVAVPSAVVADTKPARTPTDLRDPFASQKPAWDRVIARHGPALYRTVRSPIRPRIVITTAAPSAKVASRWGDWHFGTDFARAIQRLGYEVHVQTLDHADSVASRCYDIHIVLRGLAPVRRTPGQRQMIWIISQPETITTEEIDEADLVYVASERFAEDLRLRTETPVEVLLQATDHRRFRPAPADPQHAHDVVFVAKARTGVRPVVADALAGGIRPALYGTGWESYVDPTLVVAQYVPNEILPAVYASAGVVLNDHTTDDEAPRLRVESHLRCARVRCPGHLRCPPRGRPRFQRFSRHLCRCG